MVVRGVIFYHWLRGFYSQIAFWQILDGGWYCMRIYFGRIVGRNMAKLHHHEILRKECFKSLPALCHEGTAAKWSVSHDHKMAQDCCSQVKGARKKMDSEFVLVDVGRGVLASDTDCFESVSNFAAFEVGVWRKTRQTLV